MSGAAVAGAFPAAPRAVSTRDWIAVIGSILGAFMAVLDIQITNASLADIQGSLGASLDEGSWISTGYLMAEIVVIPMTGWLALVSSTAGVSLIVLGRTPASSEMGGPSIAGDLLVVMSLVIALGWVLMNKKLMQAHPPVVVTSYGLVSGAAMLALVVLVTRGAPPVHGISGRVWLALAASGILCTASTTLLWNWGMHRVPASRAGVFLNLEPAMGSLLGVELLGDHLGPMAWVGGGLIVAAAIALTTSGHGETTAILE